MRFLIIALTSIGYFDSMKILGVRKMVFLNTSEAVTLFILMSYLELAFPSCISAHEWDTYIKWLIFIRYSFTSLKAAGWELGTPYMVTLFNFLQTTSIHLE